MGLGSEQVAVRAWALRDEAVSAEEPKSLRAQDVGEPREAVISPLVRDVLAVECLGQPLASVEADLDVEGEPGLEPDVHEAEPRVKVVVVEVEALARL